MSKLKLEIKYYWKELSDEGLLKKPRSMGPYYGPVSLNNWDSGYDSEEDALADLLSKTVFEGYSLVLIKEVRMLDADWN